MIAVYARLDDQGRILEINSDLFLPDTEGWTLIDEGYGDRYTHAQGNYLPGPAYTEDGIPRYRWDGKKVLERAAEDIQAAALVLRDRAEAKAREVAEQAQAGLRATVLQALGELGLSGIAEDVGKIKTALSKIGIKL